MSGMIGADSEFSGRMYHDLDDFVDKFTKSYIVLKPETVEYTGTNPITNEPSNFLDTLAYLVAEYIRRSDLLRQTTKMYKDSPNPKNRDLVKDVQIGLHKRAMELNAIVQTARAHRWLDEGLQAKLDKLKQKNTELENKIDDLTNQLKECQENYASYQEFVKKPKGGDQDDAQFGDVVSS